MACQPTEIAINMVAKMRHHVDLVLEENVQHSHMLDLNTGITSHHEISNILTIKKNKQTNGKDRKWELERDKR